MKLFEGLKDGERLTKSRKDDAMYALASYTNNLSKQPETEKWQAEKDWQLAELRKHGTVRTFKDKTSNHTIVTTFGTVDGESGYYGVDANTGEMIGSSQAMEIYYKSRA